MAQNNKRFESMEKRTDGIDRRMDAVERTIATLQAEVNDIRHDLQVFFRDLGCHEQAIDNLKSKL
jgi:septal ring factor EnvC (AmiA/AmiB activator)